MIFLYRAKLLILSQSKTGSTALNAALNSRASIFVNDPPEMKHLGYRKYMRYVAPWIHAQTNLKRKDYEVVAVMREPIDWLGSWYRYRTRKGLSRPDKEHTTNYTGDISFNQFVLDVCKPKSEQPAYAKMTSPCAASLDSPESIGVDRLYPYEDMFSLYELVAKRTEKNIDVSLLNESPKMTLELSDEAMAKAREKFAFAFEVHASLKPDGAVDPRFRRKKNAPPSANDDDD